MADPDEGTPQTDKWLTLVRGHYRLTDDRPLPNMSRPPRGEGKWRDRLGCQSFKI